MKDMIDVARPLGKNSDSIKFCLQMWLTRIKKLVPLHSGANAWFLNSGAATGTRHLYSSHHGPRLYVCQAPNVFKKCVSGVAPPKHQMRLYVCHQMRLYVCHQMRLYVCHQMRLYVCHQMRLYVCHQMCLLNPQRSSLRSLTFARFARTFFDSPN